MQIFMYYRGGTGRITGCLFDTEKKIYRKVIISADEWTNEKGILRNGFVIPGDMNFFFPTLSDMEMRISSLRLHKFTEDETMPMDFGIFAK